MENVVALANRGSIWLTLIKMGRILGVLSRELFTTEDGVYEVVPDTALSEWLLANLNSNIMRE